MSGQPSSPDEAQHPPAALSRRRCLLAGLLAGLGYAACTALAFDPIGFWPAGLLAVAPLAGLTLWMVAARARARWCGLGAAVGALPWWLFSLHWIVDVSALGYAPLALFMSAYLWLFVAAARSVCRGVSGWVWPISFATAWLAVEFLRGSVVLMGFPWYLAGHPLIDAPPLLLSWPAAIGGAYLVSWLVALLGALLAIVWSVRTSRKAALTGLAVFGGLWLGGGLVARVMTPADDGSFEVAVIQTNVPQDNKTAWFVEQRVRDFAEMQELVEIAANVNPDVIVWPESMFPGFTLAEAEAREEARARVVWRLEPEAGRGLPREIPATLLRSQLLDQQAAVNIPMLVGATANDGLEIVADDAGRLRYLRDARYNSVFLIEDGAVAEARYDKLRLTPFGEVMPYISAWPWLEQKFLAVGARGMAFDLSPGAGPVRFEVRTPTGDVTIATPICFEATVAPVCRRLVFEGGERRAGLLVNATNDGWFGSFTAGRRHHMLAARWRCVELATPMVRAANTGISAAIDARGAVLASGVDGQPGADLTSGVLTTRIEPGRGVTPYARVGDWPGWLSVLAVAAMMMGGVVRRRFASARPEPAEDAV